MDIQYYSILIILIIYSLSYTISNIIFIKSIKSSPYSSKNDKILYSYKGRKILKKLARNDKVKEFLSLSENRQKGKWKLLLQEVLPEKEYKLVEYVSKDNVKRFIKR